MNNIKTYINNEKNISRQLEKRGFDLSILESWKKHYLNGKKIRSEIENYQFQLKEISKKFVNSDQNGKKELSLTSKDLKIKMDHLKQTLEKVNEDINSNALLIPNVPRGTVPYGLNEKENVVVWTKKEAIRRNKPHWELMESLNIASERGGVALSGTRFIQYLPKGAELVRKLVNYMIDFQIARNYVEVTCPYIVNETAMINTGQLPNLKQDVYKLANNQYLIPTGEVTLTNLHANEIFKDKNTRNYVTYSPCFRKESGAAGKDNRGLIRIHQFNKVELVKICHFSRKEEEFKHLQDSVEKILDSFEIPYRKVHLCSGDLGFTSAETFDYEIWNSGVGKYREISSASIMEDFQSNRMKTRFLEEDNSKTAAITMNASSLPVGRLIAAIIENNYDSEKNLVRLPKVLIPYFSRKYL